MVPVGVGERPGAQLFRSGLGLRRSPAGRDGLRMLGLGLGSVPSRKRTSALVELQIERRSHTRCTFSVVQGLINLAAPIRTANVTP